MIFTVGLETEPEDFKAFHTLLELGNDNFKNGMRHGIKAIKDCLY